MNTQIDWPSFWLGWLAMALITTAVFSGMMVAGAGIGCKLFG